MVAEPAGPVQVSQDAVLGGRLLLRQPLKGHRVGHDAILLAAATSARPGEHLVELGAGVGAAALAVLRRAEDVDATLVDIDPALTAFARENGVLNGLAQRVRTVCLDVAAPDTAFVRTGLTAAKADRVMANPPFNPPHNTSPVPARRLAHSAPADGLPHWIERAAWLLRPGGIITLIWRADGLVSVTNALSSDFGGIAVLPVHPKPAAPAIRLLVRAAKGSRARLSLLPGLILADDAGRQSPEAEAVLRHAAVLPLADL
jgi:tRNA1(Val) A37 N6-methylase TrmN6